MDVEMHLESMGLSKTIISKNECTNQERAKAMIFLRHHIDEALKMEYLMVKDPFELWTNLKDRFGHLKSVILPKAKHAWQHLRLQDFKTVADYNSMMFKITSQLRFCGENISDRDMLEKTFTTFHASNIVLQQQYRERGFNKYCDLITCLLVAEQNNELLLKNHESRPTGASPFPEVNAIQCLNNMPRFYRGRGRGQGSGRGFSRGRGFGRGRGMSRGRGADRGRGRGRFVYYRQGYFDEQESNRPMKRPQNDIGQSSKKNEDKCYRCGMAGHWFRNCRSNSYFVELYQNSLKQKDKVPEEVQAPENVNPPEINFSENVASGSGGDKCNDNTQLDVSDFLVQPEGGYYENPGDAI
ncbi:uncharacterized protein LOC127252968 [Andrographis paniculata]|uniref:uncharacterized protein LOC127252968 n=1 Tax=Andrographis paniculata TaxID=175694 RepID=UPI0021E77C2D|nr:uncharacterized protein LOC127252968 [Andrographis paniculata]